MYDRTTVRLVEQNCLAHRLFTTGPDTPTADDDRDANTDGRDAA